MRQRQVLVYSRSGCHLCEKAIEKLEEFKKIHNFELKTIDIDSDADLIAKYSEQVPVIFIDGNIHDFFKVDEARFLKEFGAIS